MAKVLVFQHVPYEPLGLLDPLIRQQKHRIRYVNFGRQPRVQIDVRNYDALVVLGGPMNVGEESVYPHLKREQEYIREAASIGIPILGICLGAQLIAAAFGAAVKPCRTPEIGWYPVELTSSGRQDPVLGCIAQRQQVFQWHGYTFDLPNSSAHLIVGEECANQGFRIGDNIYGIQFHLEADLSLIQRWLNLPLHQPELDALGGEDYAEKVWRDTLHYWESSRFAALSVFRSFLGQLPRVKQTICFTHR